MPPDALASFQAARPRLAGIARRMLGSAAAAEDVVQDAWLRWHQAEPGVLRDPTGYLVRVVTRLCLDRLNSASARHEVYPGPWLPEPVLEPLAEEAEALTTTLLLALERLTPLERAAFLLHDIFEVSFAEVATSIGRDEAACRQLAARARRHLHAARPRVAVAPEEGERMAAAFLAASRDGDLAALRGLLAEGVVMHTDGGGRRPAALNPIRGVAKVARMLAALARKRDFAVPRVLRQGLVDGLPGYVTLEPDGLPQTTALAMESGRIVAIYIVRNPDKLGRVA